MRSTDITRRFFLFTILTLASVGFASAQSTPDPASQITEFDVNGMKVLVKRRPGTPTISADLFVKGGVRNTTAANAGIENFALSAAIEGSKSYPRQKLRKETSRMATVLTAASTYDYSVIALGCTKPNFDASWQIFTDVVQNPLFAAADVDSVRQELLTGLRAQSDSPESALGELNDKVVFANHPYGNDPVGTTATVSKFTPAELAAYYKKVMQTSQLLLVVVGDVEPDAIRKAATAAFGSMPRGNYKDAAVPALSFSQPTLEVAQKPLQTDYVQGTFSAPSIADPDYYAMREAMSILQQRVFQEVRVKRNLSYAPDAELDKRAANTGNISVSSTNPNESISVMLAEIQRLKKEPVDEETLAEMSGFFLTTYYMSEETNAAQAGELAQYELTGGGWRNSLNFLEKVRQVKPADIQAVANKYMKNLQFSVVGNPADVNRSIFLQNV